VKFRVKASAIVLDYCKANALATDRFLFDRTQRPEIRCALMSSLGQKRTFSDVQRLSALPPNADIG
jgi:hypothetical protein